MDNPINKPLTIRLDNLTEQLLLDYCQKNNISKSEAIRKGIHLLLAKK
ncbi:CopG family transcriptional regulator [Lysinibacillus mangiferihumi]|uniref:CopG family transcriptional regulator n=1 Tax=Lysinibacillus mangiferihumi TaxID=1130819 RepID=A0A4U2Z5J9_9BACI|nr:CopG family transcriptional regulator [Lysinibacillus mangiferihumi]